jgi:hypothetical protein
MTEDRGFIVKRADRAASPVWIGARVYTCKGWDYGFANEDTRRLGVEHVSVTLDPTGDYPFFTIPREDLALSTSEGEG